MLKTTKKSTLFITATALCSILSTGCSSEPENKNPTYTATKSARAQLSDRDVFDENLNREITEEDIQQAIAQAYSEFYLPAKAPIILVQSGATAPDAFMQTEMNKYYRVSVNSGVPQPKARVNKKGEEPVVQNNYMKVLRLMGAKGRQRAVIVYWGKLETGRLDEKNNTMIWAAYEAGKTPEKTTTMRYLLRFAIVDVKTGNWATYSPVNVESEFIRQTAFNSNTVSEASQVEDIKQKAYTAAAHDLSVRFDKTSGGYKP